MLDTIAFKKEFDREIEKVPALKRTCNTLLKGDKDALPLMQKIWDSLLIDARERTTSLKFYYELTNANKIYLKMPLEDLIRNIYLSEEPILYFVNLCHYLEVTFNDLIHRKKDNVTK